MATSAELPRADEIFAEFPQWKDLARIETSDDGKPYLVIEVPAPAEACVEYGLIIDTSNDEVIVGFDCYHSHYDEWVGDGEHFGTQAALEFVRQILSERVAVVSWWQGETWCGSAQLEAGQPIESISFPASREFNLIRVRSWHGSLNRDVVV